jgi:cytochrome c-type biogenesis protein CcmH
VRKLLLAIVLALAAQAGLAATAVTLDAAAEKRAAALAQELRCLVCQNQSLADSNAGLASDLNQQIRLQLAAGKSDREIVDFMVDRYGDFVLYRPPFKPVTWLLWIGPFLLLVAGLAALVVRLKRHKPNAPRVSDAELERAAARLDEPNRSSEG